MSAADTGSSSSIIAVTPSAIAVSSVVTRSGETSPRTFFFS
jgi:hypothetical protein